MKSLKFQTAFDEKGYKLKKFHYVMRIRGEKAQIWIETKKIFTKFLAQPSFNKRRAQVWVETVVYTLIALTVIGIFLTFAKPKIEEIQDKTIIDQSVNILEDVNSIIGTLIERGAGNKRIIEVGIKKGKLTIDGENDQLIFEIDGRSIYTEPGIDGTQGKFVKVSSNVIASTQKIGNLNKVMLISNYSNYNITYQNNKESKTLVKSPTRYKISISNEGEINGEANINFDLI